MRTEPAVASHAIRVLCVDDHAVLVAGLRAQFGDAVYERDIRLAGPANDVALFAEVLTGTLAFQPEDIVRLAGFSEERPEANPTAAKYAYVILPNRTASSVKGYAYNPDIRILSNTEPTGTTTGVQAVKSEILGVVAANIWAKTEGPDNGGTIDSISVS